MSHLISAAVTNLVHSRDDGQGVERQSCREFCPDIIFLPTLGRLLSLFSIVCVVCGRCLPTTFQCSSTAYFAGRKNKGKILKHRHHTERESIDNTNNYCFLVYADIPVLLFIYSHFTKYELFIHTKLIIVFWCRHISYWAFIYSHVTSPKKVKKSAFQHVTKHR